MSEANVSAENAENNNVQIPAEGQAPEGNSTNTQAVADTENNNQSPGDDDLAFSEKQREYVDSLRKESAKYRTKAKDLESKYSGLNERFSKIETGLKSLFGEEESNLPPEKQVESLSAMNEQLEIKTALLGAAIEYGIPKDGLDYFNYLVQSNLESLDEGEELTEEVLEEIVKEAKSKFTNPNTSVSASSSQGGQTAPATDTDSAITLEQFNNMSVMEKSKLYSENKALYDQLYTAAKKQGKSK